VNHLLLAADTDPESNELVPLTEGEDRLEDGDGTAERLEKKRAACVLGASLPESA
jgi:hypothetical protein